ncbi:MAG: D-isomer specific 2-hydroxyacid dehydrogenase NAD-binding protein [Gemmatimonadetes bacterium]|nr:D-isomer specific 2-hydroxyacid dehydrogenase NAD-binding protein [Gemmatimonadota bacterium]
MTDPRRLVVDLTAKSENWALHPDGEARLRDEAPAGWAIEVVRSLTSSDGDGPPRSSDESLRAIVGAEIYFGFGFTADLFAAQRRLRWIHSAAAGVGNVLNTPVATSDIVVTNSAGIHGPPIGEFVVAGILHFMRGLDVAIAQQRQGIWSKAFFVAEGSPMRELSDSRVLIVGTGGLGGEAARRLTALGAQCIGVRRRPELGTPQGFARVVGMGELDQELPRADVVVLAAPLTSDTAELLTGERLRRLPRHAIVVNVARGALLDEEALADLLEQGRLRGAVLDVFRAEPLATTSRLWHLPSALVVPHVSPVSPGRFWPRQLDLFLDNWRRYVSGEPLRNLVDKQAGY